MQNEKEARKMLESMGLTVGIYTHRGTTYIAVHGDSQSYIEAAKHELKAHYVSGFEIL